MNNPPSFKREQRDREKNESGTDWRNENLPPLKESKEREREMCKWIIHPPSKESKETKKKVKVEQIDEMNTYTPASYGV